jgi:hypothetical protein
MLIVDKVSMALSVIDYHKYDVWLVAHEYEKSEETAEHFRACKLMKNRMLKVFTENELRDLFTLTHDNDI